MAVTIDRSVYPYVIQVPKSYMVQIQTVPSEIYQLDMDVFRKTLRDLEDDVEGMPFTRTHYHNAGVTVSGAVLARVVVFTDDYVIEFEDGQYRVNVVGANTNIGEKTVVNQVSVSTSNSAGLQDLNSLQAASYGGVVAVDTSSAFSGTVFPVGTGAYPVNNLGHANDIATERGIVDFRIMKSMTLNSGTDISDGHSIYADNPSAVLLTVDPNINVENVQFFNATLQGTLDGSNIFRQCALLDLEYVNGFIHECSLMGTITLGGTTGTTALIMDSYSGIAGGGAGAYPVINMGGVGVDTTLAVRNYSGGLGIENCSEPGDHSIDMASGRVIFDSTVTNGTFYIRGIADVTDNSTGSALVVDQTVTATVKLTQKFIDADETLAADGTWTIIDSEDGVTVLRVRQVTDKDGNTITLPVGAPARRVKTS